MPTTTVRKPSSTCGTDLFVFQEEIDKGVNLILRNIDIDLE